MATTRSYPVKLIDPTMIRAMPGQPRRHFDEARLTELAGSIKANGQQQVARVRPLSKEERATDAHHAYELIFGERRWRACSTLGLKLRCEIDDDAKGNTAFVAAVLENESRESLSPYERALAYTELRERLGLTEQDLATMLGFSQFSVNRYLRLGRLPKVVLELMHPARPPKEQLRVQVALELYKWDERVQLKVAPYVIGMTLGEALPVIRSGTRGGVQRGRCKDRKPSDLWKTLTSHVARTARGNNRILEMESEEIGDYVARTPLTKIDDMRADLAEAAAGMQKLEALLGTLTKRRRT